MQRQSRTRLYERVVERGAGGRHRWLVHDRITFFTGPLTVNAPHQHGAPVLLYGLYGPFGLRMAGGVWRICHAAMIPAGLVHELDIGGNPVGALYMEGDRGDALAALVRDGDEVDGGIVGRTATTRLRSLFEDDESEARTAEALDDLASHARGRSRREGDARIALISRHLLADAAEARSMEQCAREAGLSTSRFQHLFTQEMGVPFRRYRAWLRMRRAIVEVVNGSDLTGASHAAGFCDQAHFAHDFRRTFGAPASLSLRDLRYQTRALAEDHRPAAAPATRPVAKQAVRR